jgi:FixJ family two-component response regulator
VVFLIDFNMPDESGMALQARLAPRFPKAKFILISGLFDDKLTAQAKAAGFHALLPKPFGMAVLTQKIEDLMGLNPKESLVSLVRRQTGRLTT